MSPIPVNQAAAAQNGNVPTNWLPPNGPSPANAFSHQQLPHNAVLPPNASHQQIPPVNNTPGGFPQHGMLSQQPPRSGPTPLQQLATVPQNGIQSSPNMGQSMANGSLTNQHPHPNGLPQPGGQPSIPQSATRPAPGHGQLPALPSEAFHAAYRQWCQKQNLQHDDQLMHIEGKKIDLHRLHQEVIAAGTFQRVSVCSKPQDVVLMPPRLPRISMRGPS